MFRAKKIGLIAAVAILAGGLSARAQTLAIGDPAPKIEVKKFVKGEPVKSFEPGKNYVVEFWATWCGPCKTSIPHLTELQKKHPEVAFIGVSVFERAPEGVEPFVKEMGDKMDYRVAMDSVPEGKNGGEGAMAQSWMEAAAQEGIPTAFIVNKEGKIAWMGHPMAMEKPLEKIIAGDWDIKTAAQEIRKEKEKQKEAQAAMQKVATRLQKAAQSGDPKQLLVAIDEVIAEKPELEQQLSVGKLRILIKLDEQDKIIELAKKLDKMPIAQVADGLNFIAWSIIDPDSGIKPNAKLVQVALDFAKRADQKADEKNGAIADTLAKAYFDSGDFKMAVKTQERAIGLSEKAGDDSVPAMKRRLEQYRKASSK